jgi:hypothetical protein
MAIYGLGDLKDAALHSLWDSGEITKVRLQDGTTFDALLGDLNAAMSQLNSELMSAPHYSELFAVQDMPEVEYPIGTSNAFAEATEYSIPDYQRGQTTGHMLPLKAYDYSLGWTLRYMAKCRRDRIDADVQAVVIAGRDNWQQKLLTRFFSKSGNTVGSTSNADAPFADGGTVDSSYIPPNSPEGEAFLYTHNHFLGYGTSGITQNTVDQSAVDVAVEHLQEHGFDAPFDLIGARVDASSYTSITGWKAPEWPGIVYHASAVERAAVSELSRYFGYIETDYGVVRVWLTPRVPTYHFGMFKAFGAGNTRNPLRVRVDQQIGFGYRLVPGAWANAPQMVAVANAEFGVGVGDRVNGVCVDAAASTYSSPTIS